MILFCKLFNLFYLFIYCLFVCVCLFYYSPNKKEQLLFCFIIIIIIICNIYLFIYGLYLNLFNFILLIYRLSVVFNMEPLLVQPVISSYVLYSSVHIIIK